MLEVITKREVTEHLKESKMTGCFTKIFLFALGAGIGSMALLPMAGRAIWLSCLLLGVSFCLMFLKEDIEELEQLEQMEAHKK